MVGNGVEREGFLNSRANHTFQIQQGPWDMPLFYDEQVMKNFTFLYLDDLRAGTQSHQCIWRVVQGPAHEALNECIRAGLWKLR